MSNITTKFSDFLETVEAMTPYGRYINKWYSQPPYQSKTKTIFIDNHDQLIRVQVTTHQSDDELLLMEIGNLRKEVNKMAHLVEKLTANEQLNQQLPLSPPRRK